jgi:hypothetical protein
MKGNFLTGENVWYHGSNKLFDKFEHHGRAWADSKVSKGVNQKSPGIFFTDSKEFICDYLTQLYFERLGKESSPEYHVYTVKFDRDVNLFDMSKREDCEKIRDRINTKKFYSEFKRTKNKPTSYKSDISDDEIRKGLESLDFSYTENQVFADIVRDVGYDGVVIKIRGIFSCYIFDPDVITIVRVDSIPTTHVAHHMRDWFLGDRDVKKLSSSESKTIRAKLEGFALFLRRRESDLIEWLANS